ncbi:MAG: MFS transporter [Coriobacteriales bacterium]|jgi:MFS family permease|nr:MFS transporter [Coriobacteriales bacterium]
MNKGTARAWLSGIGAILITVFAICPFSMVSLYMTPMATELSTPEVSVTVGQIAIALSISTIGGFVVGLLIGRLIKVINVKILVILGALFVFAFQFSLSISNSLIPIYIAAFFNGAGTVIGGMAMAQIVITQWFVKGQGMMMSACFIALSLVAAICVPIVGSSIVVYGYRSVVLVVGIIAGVGIALSSLLISGAPAKYGLQPLGTGKDESGEALPVSIPSLSWSKIVRSPVFWAIWLICLLAGTVIQGFNSQGAVIFGSLGLDEVNAAFALSVFTLLCIPMTFVFGFISDRTSPKIALYIHGGISAVILLFSFFWVGWIGAIFVACAMGVASILPSLYGPNAAPRIFGTRDAGDMIGFVNVAASLGATIGPIFTGFMYDTFGNYQITLTVMGVLLVICLLLNIWLNGKKNIEKIKQQIAEESA